MYRNCEIIARFTSKMSIRLLLTMRSAWLIWAAETLLRSSEIIISLAGKMEEAELVVYGIFGISSSGCRSKVVVSSCTKVLSRNERVSFCHGQSQGQTRILLVHWSFCCEFDPLSDCRMASAPKFRNISIRWNATHAARWLGKECKHGIFC